MFCTNCGAIIRDGAKFCENCGTRLVILPESQVQQTAAGAAAAPEPAPEPAPQTGSYTEPTSEPAPQTGSYTEPAPEPAPQTGSFNQPEPAPEWHGLRAYHHLHRHDRQLAGGI